MAEFQEASTFDNVEHNVQPKVSHVHIVHIRKVIYLRWNWSPDLLRISYLLLHLE